VIPEGKDEIFNPRGKALVHIAANPNCTIPDLADALYLTKRTIWGIIGDLKRAGMIHILREGRCHRYTVNLSAPLPHPSVKGCILWHVLKHIEEAGARERTFLQGEVK